MTLTKELQGLYNEKIACFENLLSVLDKEADILKSGDVAPLWPLAEEKQKAAGAIMEVRERIKQVMVRAGRPLDVEAIHFQPQMLKDRLSHGEQADLEPFFLKTEDLGQQVRSAADANITYVSLCLDVVGEMMSVFMRPQKQAGYDRSRHMAGTGNGYVNRRV
ncbi:FlgN protein [Desulfobotulus alkaliphilus]|uniref:FlgN protein n=1 Tax=Desulfobotulus alkaliphilus TaxID=622671 RepID=A0A562RVG4_9BACT|nr:flagellar export chaperone FlgN [Desulfobotulus alkaliphilus]TWI72386.1 FlgN protein [Desulfobotulus alkaliphilus]